jgi:thiol:disulfide interchange protein DsbC
MSIVLAALAISAAAGCGGDPRIALASKVPGLKPEELHAAAIPGMFEFMRGGDVLYISADGRYGIAGDLYDLRSNSDLTENRRREMRLRLMATVSESQMVIFGPKNARYTVTVFTDVDCTYCRKLHSEIAEYNRLGIRVRYMFFPRSGPNSESWIKAEQVWCSPDRNEALTRAKRGESLDVKLCADAPIAREYELGEQFKVKGTPVIILGNGELLPGYVPPPELARQLASLAQ